MSKKVEKEEPIIVQLGSIEGDAVWKVVHPFFLDTKPGPLTVVEEGALVQLKQESALILFMAGSIEPLKLSPTFRALRNFNFVLDGCWVNVAMGDVLKMDFQEALDRLRRLEIEEIKEEMI